MSSFTKVILRYLQPVSEAWGRRIDEEIMATKTQPAPEGEGSIVLFGVVDDLVERARAGKERYGTFLRTDNGRDALVDAYQEALDLCMYLKQAIMERDNGTS